MDGRWIAKIWRRSLWSLRDRVRFEPNKRQCAAKMDKTSDSEDG